MSKLRGIVLATSVIALGIVTPALAATSSAGAAARGVMIDGYHCSYVSHAANRTLTGRSGQVVCGLGSGDRLLAGGGTEVLIAGPGRDTLIASSDPSTTDVLIAGRGSDTLIGGAGTDTLIGGAGRDVLRAGSGTEVLYAGTGRDVLYGGTGQTTLVGGAGSDKLLAGSGPTTLIAGSGTQRLSGGSGHDLFLGGRGRTTIHAGRGSHDLFAAASGTTSLDCGSSSDSTVAPQAGDVVSADCHQHGDHEGDYQFYEGVVTGVSGSQMTVTYADVNDNAQTWLDANGDPKTVTFDLTGATVHSDTGSVTPAVNDCAATLATTPTSGLVLPATFVELHTCQNSEEGLQRYRGVVTGVTGSQMTVAWSDANDTAQSWLAANGNPASVTFDLTGATIESHTGSSIPAVNDCVRVLANTPTSGLLLPAVRVELHACDHGRDGLQGYRGTLTGVTGSLVTVAYTDVNDAAQAWLDANGDPTSVTFDVSSAKIESETGSSTPALNDCIEVGASTPTSGLVQPAVYVELGDCEHHGDGGGDQGSDLQRYRGVVSAASGSQMTVTYSDANDTAQTWLDANGDPKTVTFDLSSATIESSTGSSVPSVNDCVGVSASTPSSGLILTAVMVELHSCNGEDDNLQLYLGSVTAVSGSQMTLSYTHVNDVAQSWLDANSDPTTVTFDLTGAKIDTHTGSTTPATGDCAGVAASTPTSGLVLPAVSIELFTCGNGGGDG